MPTFFLYDSRGELTDRADNFDQLRAKLPAIN